MPSFLTLAVAAHGLIPLLAAMDVISWRHALLAVVLVHLVLLYGSLWPRSRLLGPNLLRLGARDHGGDRVYLTFDDGPDPQVTPRVLDMLDQAGARASFFVVGEKLSRHPDLARRIVESGHRIENHSQHHRHTFSLLGPWRMAREIEAAQEAIERLTGRAPHYFRAPAGLRNPWLGPLLRRRQLSLVTWTRRGFDAASRRPDRVLARLTRKLGPGDILVLHDGGSAHTADGEPVVCRVLPRLLEHLSQRGLQAAALPERQLCQLSAMGRRVRHGIVKVFDLLYRPDEPPARKAASFACGVFIGCLPLYGLHLTLSAITARLLRLSLVRIYLGAHINNPLTAVPLLYIQLGLGSLLLGRSWPSRLPESLAAIDLLAAGWALVLGSVASGLMLAGLTAAFTLRLTRRAQSCPEPVREAEQAALSYIESGVSSWAFARGKLRGDPLYPLLALSPELGVAREVLDLGCGVGLVLAGLRSSPRPDPLRYLGLDASPGAIRVARASLGRWGRFEVADIRTAPYPPSDAVILADVLHYMNEAEQDAILERTAGCLRAGGALLLREADAGGGYRFAAIRVSERLRAILRGDGRRAFHYRSRRDWVERLTRLGLEVSWQPAGQGTPFANVLLTARRSPG